MQIKFAVRHGSLSEKTQSAISSKVGKLERYFERLTEILVTVDLEHKETPRVDLHVSAEHKHDFVASDQKGDLMASVDSVVHKLEQQLRKYKEKVTEHHRAGQPRETPSPQEG